MKFIEKTFGHRVVSQVKYDSKEQKKRECHHETRKGVLDEIKQWTDTYSDAKNCWWITGKPAVGKSTIGAKAAETFEDEKSLYAQYFVTRSIAATTDPENLLPTMAQQLAENSVFAAQAIEDKLRTTLLSDVKKFSYCQVQVLLLEPLRAIAQYAPKVMVVIDGVDEFANAEPSVLSKVTSVLCSIMLDLPRAAHRNRILRFVRYGCTGKTPVPSSPQTCELTAVILTAVNRIETVNFSRITASYGYTGACSVIS